MALGLLNRMTPQLSIFVVGFPLTLTIGMLTLGMLIPMLAPFTEHMLQTLFDRLAVILSEMHAP